MELGKILEDQSLSYGEPMSLRSEAAWSMVCWKTFKFCRSKEGG